MRYETAGVTESLLNSAENEFLQYGFKEAADGLMEIYLDSIEKSGASLDVDHAIEEGSEGIYGQCKAFQLRGLESGTWNNRINNACKQCLPLGMALLKNKP